MAAAINPILIDLPFPIQTRRLIIRMQMPGDGPALNEALRESWDRLKLWVPFASGDLPTVEQSEERSRRKHTAFLLREDLSMILIERMTGRMLGGAGLHRINWEAGCFEMGYWNRTSVEGQGFVTEAAIALTQYAFRQLKATRVEIRCAPPNERSTAIPKKLGYELEGTLRNHHLAPASREPQDLMVFARFHGDGLPDVGASW
jgi:ribosomal-protein-serine acetyltransferase